jgi:hypothetical protein
MFRPVEKPAVENKPGARPESIYIIPPEPVRGGVKPKTSATTNYHIVMEFGLQVRGSNPRVQKYFVPLKAQADA